ncbi:MAG: ThiF family adenylyltransferase [Myxococcota bacterium]
MSALRSALVVGAGGLGCPALLELAAAGVPRLGILEPDRVELSNLHRQILYREADVGAPKATVAAQALRAAFAGLIVDAHVAAFGPETAGLLRDYDAVLDGTDRFETKLLLSDACIDAERPFVFGGVIAHDAQVLGVLPGRSACPRCFFEDGPPPGYEATCSELGILGPIAGIAAAYQVEVLRSLFTEAPEVDVLRVYDGRRDHLRKVSIRRDPRCLGCGQERRRASPAEPLRAQAGLRAEGPVLDLRAMVCPATFVATRRALEPMQSGQKLWVVLSGDEAKRNVPASVRAAGHRILAQETDGQLTSLLVERGEGPDLEGAP